MATLNYDPNDPNNSAGATGGNAFAGTGGYVSGGGQGATTAAASPSSPAPTSSGHFTNLVNYLNANQQSGATTGQAVENVANLTGQNAQDALNAYKSEGASQIGTGQLVDPNIENKIASGVPSVDQAKLNQISGGVVYGNYYGPGGIDVSYSGYSPTAASYGGPADATGFSGQTAADQAKAYQSISKLVGGAPGSANYGGGIVGQAKAGLPGTASLLRSTYQQPSYTTGENTLDAFITGGTGGQAALNDIGTKWGNIGTQADQINAGFNNQIAAARQNTTNTNDRYAADVARAQAQSAATQKTYADAIAAARARANAYVEPAPPPVDPAKRFFASPVTGEQAKTAQTVQAMQQINPSIQLPRQPQQKPHGFEALWKSLGF